MYTQNKMAFKKLNLGFLRFPGGEEYDPAAVIREYSVNVSSVVDLEKLEQVSVNVIGKAIGTKRGRLFLVEHITTANSSHFMLKPIRPGETVLPAAIGKANQGENSKPASVAVKEYRLEASSPLVAYFLQARQPLEQREIESAQRFRELTAEERRWLAALEMDVYVPVFSKSGWIGLLTLGGKLASNGFAEQDLVLLGTLADLAAVALENARLVNGLAQANRGLKQAQQDIEQANVRLREMDELKSSFLSVITHEMRTPLANMAFSMQIMQMYGDTNFLPEQREQLDQIGANLATARRMIDNLVTFASFLNKQVRLSLEPVDFKLLVLEALVPLKPAADDKKLDLQISSVGDMPAVHADVSLVKDAIQHLVHNAIKYTNEGGSVWVSSWATTDAVCFDVKDNGVGVPPEKLKALWDSFSQATDPLRRGLEGLGLGLSLVRFIVAAHNGKVWVESEPGKGSTFGFQIPIKGPPVAMQ
ncbi:MAG TPA: GAF domain-containing sensor histidine kinase [Anaerolineales bacterium]|nr:GAF domain-containing sensor histidine kinase [Anaerolineales bacterium]